MTKIPKSNLEQRLFVSFVILSSLVMAFLSIYLATPVLSPSEIFTQPPAETFAQIFGLPVAEPRAYASLEETPSAIEAILDSLAGTAEPTENIFSRKEGNSSVAPTPLYVNSTDKPLYLGSFGYSYNNVDESQTTLYFDNTSKGLLFPAVYDWTAASPAVIPAEQSYFSSLRLNDFNGPYNDRRCRGDNCLEQDGNQLFYNGQALAAPSGLNPADIAAVTIGVLPSRWLVGYTLRDGAKYRGEVYYFDGRNFRPLILPNPVISDYFGLWGFGGEDNDFLVIYGAYEGQAYQVRGDSFTDLRKFFGIKVMSRGFKAAAVKVAVGKDVNWYISSETLDRPRFLKLWQNHGSEIIGETVLTDLITSGSRSAAWRLREVKAGGVSLVARIVAADGREDWRLFTDRGFANSRESVLITRPITHDGLNSEIIIRKLVKSQLDLDGASQSSVKFLFSIDGRDWRDIPLGQNLDFTAGPLRSYLLKIIFSSAADKFYSPYISSVYFDYACEKSSATSLAQNGPTAALTNDIPVNQVVPPANISPVEQEIPPGAVRLAVSAQGFSPPEFRVKAGEKVTIALTAVDDKSHVLVFPRASLMALTTLISGGETKLVTFTAPVAGQYQFRDDVPAYRSNQGEMIAE